MLTNPLYNDKALNRRPPVYLTAPPIAPSGVELQHLISAPETECDLEALARAITIQDIIFECEGDGPMAQHPGFPGAIRQVIGSELMKTASKEALGGVACPWGPACGLHVFFNGQRSGKGLDIPPPWIIRSETTGANSLRITLRLFGLGLLWSSELSEACHRAIERGISLAGKAPICQSVLIRSVETVWTGLQDDAPTGSLALVFFVTPYESESNTTQAETGEDFIKGLFGRCEAVARWHGLSLAEDWATIENTMDHIRFEEKGLGEIEWNRCLSQSGGANMMMKGQMGLLQIHPGQENTSYLVRLLQIGELLHAGQKIAFGQGRYDLFLTPLAGDA
ncbi:hypothetical protein [Cohaesibacter celericrescens]|uniref:CRISPR-associated protein Cas6 C-terminal domain-containing protein n=1 Tax=Cohaesibacter celericrescens TaxID=2067669 RepID=A0A2N5XKQ5_9HYPH|nr:hypothetical protein [Cohaesibacter celericrescens]PLW75017.1 hypothetical protein C0081_22215 [Cohaesibacter celericrescens]